MEQALEENPLSFLDHHLFLKWHPIKKNAQGKGRVAIHNYDEIKAGEIDKKNGIFIGGLPLRECEYLVFLSFFFFP